MDGMPAPRGSGLEYAYQGPSIATEIFNMVYGLHDPSSTGELVFNSVLVILIVMALIELPFPRLTTFLPTKKERTILLVGSHGTVGAGISAAFRELGWKVVGCGSFDLSLTPRLCPMTRLARFSATYRSPHARCGVSYRPPHAPGGVSYRPPHAPGGASYRPPHAPCDVGDHAHRMLSVACNPLLAIRCRFD